MTIDEAIAALKAIKKQYRNGGNIPLYLPATPPADNPFGGFTQDASFKVYTDMEANDDGKHIMILPVADDE